MTHQLKTKDIVLTALLIAIGIIIPVYFSFLRVTLPPAFTATIMAHVPIFIAMFISPWAALFTAIGTTLGFLFTTPLVVAIRAASHVIFALVGAWMIQKRYNLILVGVVTALLHAVFESLVVYLFLVLGFTPAAEGTPILVAAFYVTGVGTLIHDIIDYVIACGVGVALVKAKMLPPLPPIWK
ncbi:MAG: ECF transporter S component [Clostridia bacterium]|nr:ECF transporter S component [Clostridia bacterium]